MKATLAQVFAIAGLLMTITSALGQAGQTAPTISLVGLQIGSPGGFIGPVDLQVSSPLSPSPVLTVSARSDDQSLVRDQDISITPSSGIDVTNRTITIFPSGGLGIAMITLTVSDGTSSNSTSFQVIVTFIDPFPIQNKAPIAITDYSIATPYPSVIDVEGFAGRISELKVNLRGFTHTFPSDVGALLVGPNGQKIVLMDNVGGGHPGCNDATLTFDQRAASTIPVNGPMVSGNYRPLDNSGGSRNFQGSAPPGPYTNTFDAFKGSSPNGTWSLYVEDFDVPDSGAISNGWSLEISTEPAINGLTDIAGTSNGSLVQNFTVGDDNVIFSSSSPRYQFTALSDNQSVVTNGGIVISTNGTNWTITLNPVPGASGSANITVFGTDQFLNQFSASFKATFVCEMYPGGIAPLPDQTIHSGSITSIPLLMESDCAPGRWQSFSFESSNTNLIPLGNLKLIGTNLVFWPAANLTGTARLTVVATSADGSSTTTDFGVTVVPSPVPLYANANTIVINDNSPATPYPSTIEVSGRSGSVTRVTAALLGMGHAYPADVSILMVGPQGQAVVLMSRAGGSVAFTNNWLKFDDSANNLLPQFTLLQDGAYRPTDYKVSDHFFSPAPSPPYANNLSTFNGTDPNGTWSLYVEDDQAQDNGAIAGGWLLQIETQGINLPFAAQTTLENQPLLVPFTVSSPTIDVSNILVTVISTNESPPGLIEALTLNGSGVQRSLLIRPRLNWPSAVTNTNGTCTILLSVTDGMLTNVNAFALTVMFEDQRPTISGLTDQTAFGNLPLIVNFVITDADTPVSNLLVSASVSSELLGKASVNDVVSGSNSVIYLPTGARGTNLVTITVSDGTLTNTGTFVVISAPLPTLEAFSSTGATGNSFKIRFAGAMPRENFILQRSADLHSWIDAGALSADASGAGEFDLQLDGSTVAAFYRIRSSP